MKKRQIIIDLNKFARAHKKLKSFEDANGNINVGSKNLSRFLGLHASVINDKSDPLDVRVKRRILFIAGDFVTNPATLQPAIKLKSNLGYGADEFTQLQIRLDALVKELKPSASISKTEANNCATVGDCTKLVKTKTA